MRTSVRDELLALRRPAALAALVAGAGGVVGAMAPALPLWALDARVQALDTIQTAPVATLAGHRTTTAVWLGVGAGIVVLAFALLVAVDRPPPAADRVLLLGGLVIGAIAVVGRATRPVPASFVGDPHAAELLAAPVALPTGVGIELLVRPAGGLLVLGAAALAVVLGTVLARRG